MKFMRLLCTLLLLFFSSISFAQEGNAGLLAQAEDVLYSDPKEAARIADYILEKSSLEVELLKATYLRSLGFYMEGKTNEALKTGLKFNDVTIDEELGAQPKLNILLSKILKEFGINSLASYYAGLALQQISHASQEEKKWIEAKIIQFSLDDEHTSLAQIKPESLYKVKRILKNLRTEATDFQVGNINLALAEMHLTESRLDSALFYLTAAKRQSKMARPGNYLEMKSLVTSGKYLFHKNENAAAIDSLTDAMKLAEKFQNLSEQIIISEAISENYLALKDLQQFNKYNQRADSLNRIRGDFENEAINTAYNIFNETEIQKFAALRSKNRIQLYVIAGILLLVIVLFVIIKGRYRAKISQYRKFIGYLEKRKETVETAAIPKSDTVKNLNVPKEAEEVLLGKLETFEKSHDFINKDISLSRLALKFETNTKYLSEVINSHKEKNFNSYINELRINYITEKLENDPQYLQYKISYLAEVSGFSSHSVFATVFKSVTGISPTVFISLLQNKNQSPAA